MIPIVGKVGQERNRRFGLFVFFQMIAIFLIFL